MSLRNRATLNLPLAIPPSPFCSVWCNISQPAFFAAPKIWCHPPYHHYRRIDTHSLPCSFFRGVRQNQSPLSFRVPIFHFWVIWCKISTNILHHLQYDVTPPITPNSARYSFWETYIFLNCYYIISEWLLMEVQIIQYISEWLPHKYNISEWPPP